MFLSKMTAAVLDDIDYIVDGSAVSFGTTAVYGRALVCTNTLNDTCRAPGSYVYLVETRADVKAQPVW